MRVRAARVEDRLYWVVPRRYWPPRRADSPPFTSPCVCVDGREGAGLGLSGCSCLVCAGGAKGWAASVGREPAAEISHCTSRCMRQTQGPLQIWGRSGQPCLRCQWRGSAAVRALGIQAQSMWVGGTEWCSTWQAFERSARRQALTGKSRERSALQVPERCQSAISGPAPHRKTVGFSGKRSRGRPAWPDRVVSMDKGMVRLNRRSANVTVPCKPLTHIAGKTVRAPFFFLSQFCLAQPQTGSLTG